MAMSASGLKAAIIASMTSTIGAPADGSKQAQFAEALATAIVTYLVANAEIAATGVDPQGGSVSSVGTLS
jgi:tRNA A37 threonylcarbamoyltransferase TsaD